MSSDDDSTSSASDESDGIPDDTMAALLVGDLPKSIDNVQHYFVPTLDDGAASESSSDEVLFGPSRTGAVARSHGPSEAILRELDALQELPRLAPNASARSQKKYALVDYSKSILLTSTQYVKTMEFKQQRKEAALEEAKCRKEGAVVKRNLQEAERQQKEQEKN